MTNLTWNSAITISVSVTLILMVFSDTALSMVATWHRSGTFSHGFLILPISVYLVWKHRHQVASLPHNPSFLGYPILAIVGFFWLFGRITNILVIQQVSLVIMFQGLVWTVLGTEVTSVFLFPLAFLSKCARIPPQDCVGICT